jgi:protein tyrosine phosphatase (PTP) superfamily phosphohydrolase (DUF442 family)
MASVSTIGQFLVQYPDFARKNATEAGKDVGELLADALTVQAKDLKGDAGQVRDDFVNLGGGLIGYLELIGLKYGVQSYASKVSDGLTRGSRLTDAELRNLKQQGFKSVINLCLENDDDAARAKKAGLKTLHLGIVDNTAPTRAQVKTFLDYVTDPKHAPAYVHCEQGRGRTGVMVAAYRMAVEGMSTKDALAEAEKFGMRMPVQKAFIEKLGEDLAAGKLKGYPLEQKK